MIATCPACKSQYRIDVSRLKGGRGKLRCARCSNVFGVVSPEETPLGGTEGAAAPEAPKPEASPLPQAEGPEASDELGMPRADRRQVQQRSEESRARLSGQIATVLAAAKGSGRQVVVMGVLAGEFRERAVAALARCGVRTIATDTGPDCRDAALRARAGLVLASEYLPQLTAAELFEDLRAKPELARTRFVLHAPEPQALRWPNPAGRRRLEDLRVGDDTSMDQLVDICTRMLDPKRDHGVGDLDEEALRALVRIAAADITHYLEHARGLGSELEQAAFHGDLAAARNWCVDRHRGHANRAREIFDEVLMRHFGAP